MRLEIKDPIQKKILTLVLRYLDEVGIDILHTRITKGHDIPEMSVIDRSNYVALLQQMERKQRKLVNLILDQCLQVAVTAGVTVLKGLLVSTLA